MYRLSILLCGALFLSALSAPVFAKSDTLTGKLVDLSCYGVNKEQSGNAHKGKGLICGQACAREGFPVGLLTNDGKVYQVTGGLAANANAKLVPHIGQTVTITGEVIEEKDNIAVISASELR